MLFDPLEIRSIRLKNRIAISPMCQYSSIDGFANDWHLVHLGSRATGGAALIMQEATAVTAVGRISPDDMGLWKDEQIEPLKRITSFIQTARCSSWHSARSCRTKASMNSPWKGGKLVSPENGGWSTLAPSAIPFSDSYPTPSAMSQEEIVQLRNDYKHAAMRALEAGYQVIEIHGAHGYLINSFLSPLSNQRADQYGGNFENRIRILKEIVADIRTVWPENLPLFVRISSTDYAEGGWNLEASIQLSGILKTIGVDLIDASSGGLVPNVKIPLGPGYQVPFSEAIRRETGILTGAVGMITRAGQAEEILQTGKADLIFIARESLRNPDFPRTSAKELGIDIQWPAQYNALNNQQETKRLFVRRKWKSKRE